MAQGTYDYLLTDEDGNIYEMQDNIPVKMTDEFVFEDAFQRDDGPIDNDWEDISDHYPEYIRFITPAFGADLPYGEFTGASILASELSTQKTECYTRTMGNITLTGAKSAGTTGNTTQRATINGQRCLVLAQTDATENGIYVINHSGAWARATDYDEDSEVGQYTWVFVPFSQGFGLSRYRWIQVTPNPELGVDDLVFYHGWWTGYRPTYVYDNAAATDPDTTERPSGGEFASYGIFREGHRSSNFDVEVVYNQGTGNDDSSFGSQGAPACWVDPEGGQDQIGMLFTDDIGISTAGLIPFYLTAWQPSGVTETSGMYWLNYPPHDWSSSEPNKLTLRVVNGKMAGFINEDRVCGPIEVPAWATDRTKFGAWSCCIPSSLFPSQDLPNTKLFPRVTFRYTDKDLGPYPNPPSYPGAGAVSHIVGESSMDVTCPSTESGDYIMMAAVSHQATVFHSFTTPTGWTAVPEIFGGGIRTLDSSVRLQLWKRDLPADGSEGGSITTLNHVVNGVPDTCTALGFMFTIRGHNPRAPLYTTGSANSASTTLYAPSVSMWTKEYGVVWIAGIGSGDAITPPDGFTVIQETGSGHELNLVVAERAMDLDPVNNLRSSDDIMGTTGLLGTIASSVTSVAFSMGIFHDPRIPS